MQIGWPLAPSLVEKDCSQFPLPSVHVRRNWVVYRDRGKGWTGRFFLRRRIRRASRPPLFPLWALFPPGSKAIFAVTGAAAIALPCASIETVHHLSFPLNCFGPFRSIIQFPWRVSLFFHRTDRPHPTARAYPSPSEHLGAQVQRGSDNRRILLATTGKCRDH